MKIMMSAGEVSGDLHGERLARAVLEQAPDTETSALAERAWSARV